MSKPIKIKVKVNLVDKALLFHGKNGAVYLDLVAWPNKSGADEWGNTHYVKQDAPKGTNQQMPIIGNLSVPDDAPAPAKQAPPRAAQRPSTPDPDLAEDSVPF